MKSLHDLRFGPSGSRRHSVRVVSPCCWGGLPSVSCPGKTEEDRMKIEGGCLCGKVRYSADAEPAFVGVCHCKNCQKGTGTAFSVVVGVPKPALSVQGTLQ